MYTVPYSICDEIIAIMDEYDRQVKERGYVDTPGGLEHMGDVWNLLSGWRDRIKDSRQGEK